MIVVELHARKKPNDRHWYAYDVVLEGETIVSNSRDPEHELTRALLARGIKGAVEVHDGQTGKPRSRGNIDRAAKWCVGSNLEKYTWRPSKASDGSPHAGKGAPTRVDVPCDPFGHPCAAVRFPQKNAARPSMGNEAA